jgi:hypothetical protein
MNEVLTVNPSPKARYAGYKPFADAHRNLIAMPELQRAIDFAVQEMVWRLSEHETDGNNAAARHYQLQGAHDFIGILKNLAEVPIITKRQPSEREMSHEFK